MAFFLQYQPEYNEDTVAIGAEQDTMSGYFTPSYFTPIPGHPGVLPAVPPASTTRSQASSPATVRREVALGNYELVRRRAAVAEYNNPLDALQTELAIAEQEKTLHEDEERQQRRARKQERRLAKSLRNLRLDEHGATSRLRSRSHGTTRKATPYASEQSASSSSDSDSEVVARLHHHHDSKKKNRRRRKSMPSDLRRRVAEIFEGAPLVDGHLSEHEHLHTVPRHVQRSAPQDLPHIRLTAPSSDSRGSSIQTQAPSSSDAPAAPTTAAYSRAQPLRDVDHEETDDMDLQRPKHNLEKAVSNRSRNRAKTGKTLVDEPAILQLVFYGSRKFTLTHKELQAGGAGNSFLKSWTNSPRKPGSDEVLTINMPQDRDPNLFEVIHRYLKGFEVIPLEHEDAVLVCGHYPATDTAYKRLYKEAKLYGIRDLAEQIASHRPKQTKYDSPTLEAFNVYNAAGKFPHDERSLRKLARYLRIGTHSESSEQLRVVIIGGAINFVARLGINQEAVLEYSLVAPLTPIARAFSRVAHCLVDELAQQVIFEGTLTRKQCQNVLLDIMFQDPTATAAAKVVDNSSVMKRCPYTLETILLALQPSHNADYPPRYLYDAFNLQYFEGNDDDKQHDRSQRKHPSNTSISSESTSKFYLNLAYAEISLRVSLPLHALGRSSVAFEQIHTATRDVLKTGCFVPRGLTL